ncbi:hypothetical protein IFT84_13050 [Rhizobium sp. CFBP 8762]|uniref:hypothetical protein n=1 Tax=Rhizobium sp. CFBP 8762 TaxID=2775279 RepID=UPI00177FB9DA|nr:hypothetical protein [Rhizobium sp. CFBP 8762]MBD8555432.1 hypothetical protein [Rhizobium sp. CFBP 8762]
MNNETTVTNQDLERSYETLALLEVCQFAIANLEEAGGAASQLSGNIAHCIRLAERLASGTHSALERAVRSCGNST